MIGTVLRVGLLELFRDRVALALTFVMPLAFFSVFAAAFSAVDSETARAVRTLVVLDQRSPLAARMAERLAAEPGLEVETFTLAEAETARERVRSGKASVAIVLPTSADGSVELFADRSNPLAGGMIEGLVQRAAAPGDSVVDIEVVDALGRTGKRPSIAYFAAGLGVMFLMFAMTGRVSILIEERERGVLGRLMVARVGLTRLMLGRWIHLAIIGSVQVAAMFLWAAIGFGLDLFRVSALIGFVLVTVVTAATAAAFGLLLASFCRSRAQLSGVGIVLVLVLCAVGGNMFPSFLMPETLRHIGSWTFNAWALTAYQKIFWYERPLYDLWPQLGALAAAAGVFFIAARWLLPRRHGSEGLA